MLSTLDHPAHLLTRTSPRGDRPMPFPAQPVPPSAAASPIDKQRYQERVQQYEAFQNVVSEAKSLMVPILNQTQFLHFVGYNLDAMRAGAARAAAVKK